MSIRYVEGDATFPEGEGRKFIVHCCNSIGAWGAGFVLALSRKWDDPKNKYQEWARREEGKLPLGEVQFVSVGDDIVVANLIGQSGTGGTESAPPIRYDAMLRGLRTVARKAQDYGATVHMPRIGCGLAGGEWSIMEPIIASVFTKAGVQVTVYDLPVKSWK